MEENKNLWNKTTAELTVRDMVVVQVAAPIIAMGSFLACAVVYDQGTKVVVKVRSIRANRKNKHLTAVK